MSAVSSEDSTRDTPKKPCLGVQILLRQTAGEQIDQSGSMIRLMIDVFRIDSDIEITDKTAVSRRPGVGVITLIVGGEER